MCVIDDEFPFMPSCSTCMYREEKFIHVQSGNADIYCFIMKLKCFSLLLGNVLEFIFNNIMCLCEEIQITNLIINCDMLPRVQTE